MLRDDTTALAAPEPPLTEMDEALAMMKRQMADYPLGKVPLAFGRDTAAAVAAGGVIRKRCHPKVAVVALKPPTDKSPALKVQARAHKVVRVIIHGKLPVRQL